jgi:UDP-2,4-diacetamido-2,4,6-trideoxy-beta-L-altropyranose hydrolase
MSRRSAIDRASRPILIRADASPRIGAGHATRCLALAQRWRDDGGRVSRAFCPGAGDMWESYASEGIELLPVGAPAGSPEDAAETAAVARDRAVDWVVVDGYQFGPDYRRILRRAGLRVLQLDDHGLVKDEHAHILLNQNVDVDESMYPACGLKTRLLLGPRHVLLRREFSAWRGWRREIAVRARKVLVTLGGGPQKETETVVRALRQLDIEPLEAIVVGAVSTNSSPEDNETGSVSIRFVKHLADMPHWMAWADVAVSAGGSTCWEMAFMGLPNLVLVLAENQRGIARRLDARGVANSLGWGHEVRAGDIAGPLRGLILDPDRRQAMSASGKHLVDGLGARRVVDVLRETFE